MKLYAYKGFRKIQLRKEAGAVRGGSEVKGICCLSRELELGSPYLCKKPDTPYPLTPELRATMPCSGLCPWTKANTTTHT